VLSEILLHLEVMLILNHWYLHLLLVMHGVRELVLVLESVRVGWLLDERLVHLGNILV